MKEQRNFNIDLIKIIACIAVVGLHTLNKDLSILNSTLYYLCMFAVPFFWMSTGFFVVNKNHIDLKYIIKKILQISKIVIIWNGIIFIAKLFYYLLIDRHIFLSKIIIEFFKEIIKSLIQRGNIWWFWYFGALIIVYLVCYILKKYLRKENKTVLLRFWFICFTIGILIQIFSYIQGYPVSKNVIQTFRIWTWMQYFLLGGIIKNIFDKICNMLSKDKHFFIVVFVTLFILIYPNIMGRYVLHNLYAEYFYDSFFTVMWVFFLFSFILRINLNDRKKNIIKIISPLTIGIYIIHPFIIKLFSFLFNMNTIFLSVLQFVLVLVLSIIITYLINKTILRKYLIKL